LFYSSSKSPPGKNMDVETLIQMDVIWWPMDLAKAEMKPQTRFTAWPRWLLRSGTTAESILSPPITPASTSEVWNDTIDPWKDSTRYTPIPKRNARKSLYIVESLYLRTPNGTLIVKNQRSVYWRSEDGELHHIDEAMDYYDGCESEDIEEREREASGIPAPRSQYVWYGQKGRIISATKPHRIAREHVPWARAVINKRVAVMETLLHRWIDHILDSRLPSLQSQRFHKIRGETNEVRRIKHANIHFISTYQYHRLEGNDDEMDDPSKYL
jgi:hypothetical protein